MIFTLFSSIYKPFRKFIFQPRPLVSFLGHFLFLLTIFSFLPADSFAQLLKPTSFNLTGQASAANLPDGGGKLSSNGVSVIHFGTNNMWFGTGGGINMSPDLANTFYRFDDDTIPGLGRGAVAAILTINDTLWISTAYDSVDEYGENVLWGGGLSWTADEGGTWTNIPQPIDPNTPETLGYEPTTTHALNITYDIAYHNSAVWITSWGGGIRKSFDSGKTWEVVTIDGIPFDALSYNIHRGFSVISAANGLWVGTSGGVGKSIDGGETFTVYTAQNSGISGNFVTALGEQITPNGSVIWASTRTTQEGESNGVSYTEDGGMTWKNALADVIVHNFGFNVNDVFAASDDGLFRSIDGGNTWGNFRTISDPNGNIIMTTKYNEVKYNDGVLYVGTSDGLGKTNDNGINWEIERAFPTPGQDDEPEIYAYPNPFSPSRYNRYDDRGHVRFQYRTKTDTEVSLKIYDFGMNLVKTVTSNEQRFANQDNNEVWDGFNEWGVLVANGVYFYKLEKKNEGVLWGKIIVVN